jgi:hypothetical protein
VRGRNQGRFISVFKYHFLLINLWCCNQARAEAVPEPDDAIWLDEDEDDQDDTYINDGVVAPIVVESEEDDFFV